MLKKMRLGGVVLVSLLIATGCQNEEIVSNVQQKGNYSLTVNRSVDSRTYVKDDGTVVWSKGDKMYVYGKGVSGVLTLNDADADKTTGTFTGFVFGNPDDLKWAVFGDEVKGTADGAQFTIASVTDPNSNSPMVGPIVDGNVQMEHLCGMVRITINNLPDNAQIKLTGTDIAGTAEWNGTALTHTSKEGEITLVVGEGSDNTFEIPLFTTAPKEGPEEQKSLVLSVNGVECPINAPVKVGSLSQKAIMTITCITDANGKVTGFSQAATTEEALKQAIESLKSGESISFSLADDMTLEETITVPVGATVTLNLNEKTITGGLNPNDNTKHIYPITNRGTLTLENGTIDGRGVANYGTMTIEEGTTINAIDSNGGGAIWNYAGSNVVVNGGTFTAAQATAAPAATVMHVANDATAVVNGGTFKSDADWTYAIISYGNLTINDANVSGEHGAIAAETGELTINDGTYIISASGHLIYSTAATITLNGGSFKHSQNGANSEGNVILYASNSAQANVNGGSYDSVEGAFAYSNMSGNITITGGTFANKAATVYSGDFNQFIANGYKVVDKNGVYHVVPTSAKDVVSVNNASDLVSEIAEGNYVVLNENITVTEENLENITKNVTDMINLNGCKIDATISTKDNLKAALNIGATEIDANNSNIGDLDYGLNATSVPAGTTVTIKNANVNGKSYGNGVDGTVIFEGCTFSNSGAYSIHFDSGSGNVVFNNCHLNGWCSFGTAIKNVEMNGCTFNGNGTYALLRFYQDVMLTGCIFDCSNANTEDIYPEGIDMTEGKTATIVNCTNVNGEMTNLFEKDDLDGTDGIVVFK